MIERNIFHLQRFAHSKLTKWKTFNDIFIWFEVEKDKDVLDKMKEENASLQSQGLSNLWQNTNQFYDAYDAKTATSTAKPALKNEVRRGKIINKVTLGCLFIPISYKATLPHVN